MPGSEAKIFVVPTPIGNLEDITLRAIRTLKEVDLILAEDTRVTSRLLKHFEIGTPLKSYHTFNEHKITDDIIQQLEKTNQSIALVSDAGTPGISDPGYLLIKKCIEKNIAIECLPGPTAFVPALVNSGLPSDQFNFVGFLPHKKGRKSRIEEIALHSSTSILYESPHRLLKTLEQLAATCGVERRVSVSRELTKVFEENVRGTLEEVIEIFNNRKIKGEFVIILAGK